jgi:hypothetical protein
MGERSGSLTIVGTGIKAAAHATIEARAQMESAEKLLYLVADPATSYWITTLNPTAESLQHYYDVGKDRMTTYLEMVDHILSFVHKGLNVCVAFYGHPGVFVFPSHESIQRARADGYPATMLPSVSAEDCLFADLGVDPGTSGCQSFEATDFLVYRRQFDPAVSLVLWQVAVIGELGYRTDRMFNQRGIEVLAAELAKHYSGDHEVIVYEASQYPVCDPLIRVTTIAELGSTPLTPIATLYVPPIAAARLDEEMVLRLGLTMPEPRAAPGAVTGAPVEA